VHVRYVGYAAALISAVCLSFCSAVAQFYDATAVYQLYVESSSGNVESGVSFHDFDRDGLDDLTYGSVGMGVYTYRNTGDGFEPVYYFSGISGAIQHPIWVDYDNDGDSDFFTTRFGDCPVLMRNNGDMTFEDVSSVLACSEPEPHNTSASWADYDNDGFTDLYIANYYPTGIGATGWCYHNNGDGTFTENAAALGIDNGVSPTYQVLWIDYDIDGDQDLLISNDKFVGNRLYQNNGIDGFSDISQQSGFDVAINAMSLSPGDPDRDGDFDFYISNTTEGNVLMMQNGGVFTNAAVPMGATVNANCWGSVFVDTQGKMWEDIYVVATGPQPGTNRLLQNANGGSFASSSEAFQGEDSEFLYSVAKGDANNDGRYDIACNPYQNNQSLLFESQEPDSTSVKIALQGTVSNRDGIGSILTCHVGEVVQLRSRTCGENYLSQDSQYLLFASQGQAIDSVVVRWPSGIRDVLYNPTPNQLHYIVESLPENPVQMVELSMCSGDTLYLQPQDAVQVEWSTGSQDAVLQVSEPGEYTAVVTDAQGQITEFMYAVTVHAQLNAQVQVMEPSCHGASDGAIQVFTTEWSQVWINGEVVTGSALGALDGGDYEIHLMDGNGCSLDTLVTLNDPSPLIVEASIVPGCFGETSHYELHVEHAQGYAMLIGLESPEGDLLQDDYPFTVLDEMGCFYTGVLTIETLGPFEVVDYIDTLCADMPSAMVELQFSGGVAPWGMFGSELPLEALPAGDYQTQWMDAAGCIAEGNISILQFEPIEISVEENVDQIIVEVEGGLPPYAVEWSNGDVGFELTAEPGTYVCVVSDQAGCTQATQVELLVGITEVENAFPSAYPMPFEDVLQWNGPTPQSWSLFNAQGQWVADHTMLAWGVWDTRAWAPGMYVMHAVMTDGRQQQITLIKR
jgi:hypothetical protein